MKISHNWLKDYINTDLQIEKLCEILTDLGLEVGGVEKFESIKGGLEGLVVGKVMTCDKHPNADKLSCTTVNVGGTEPLNIVCGAPNVAAGQKVIVATIGTTLYMGDDNFTIKKSKIRGELSEGMICAEDEIGVGDAHEGIMILDNSVEIGTPAKKHFDIEDDFVIEIDLTPNRIDGASHIGVARDLAAFLNLSNATSYNTPDVSKFKPDSNTSEFTVEIENTEACPRYTGLSIEGVNISESPEWIQNRIKAIGLSPINNVVDITNYVLHETGQPLHAFDADMVSGNKVIAKTLPNKTKFTTLDEQERELSDTDLVICNDKEAMCIAGVFGGIKSGVTDKTKNVFLESAYFNPVYVRKTAKRHTLSTDSSFRFERGVDPEIQVYALKRAALLIKEIAGGSITSDVIDVYPKKIKRNTVELSYKNTSRLIGKSINQDTIKKILTGLEISIIEEKGDLLKLEIPSYRVDVTREADVIEEILRVYGYNNVEFSDKVSSSIVNFPKPNPEVLRNTISDMLSSNGFNEIMSKSLTKKSYYTDLLGNDGNNIVDILNPLSNDLNCMRQTLLFGGLEAVIYNANRQNANLCFYEFGSTYKKIDTGKLPYLEEHVLDLFVTGNRHDANWNAPQNEASFYQIKAHTENILQKLGVKVNNCSIDTVDDKRYDEAISYRLGKNILATIGTISKTMLSHFDISLPVYYASLNWEQIIGIIKNAQISYNEISKYPEVRRDLALLIDSNVKFDDIKTLAFKTEKKLLKKVSLFDVYEGKNLEKGKKSYAINFTIQDEDKTLKDKQIDKIMKNLIGIYEKELGAKLR